MPHMLNREKEGKSESPKKKTWLFPTLSIRKLPRTFPKNISLAQVLAMAINPTGLFQRQEQPIAKNVFHSGD